MDEPTPTLLVVDDNEQNLELLARRLERKGYTVLCAGGGRKALEIIAREAVDLVVLDVMMPEMSGFEVLEELRKTRSALELPVIIATALAGPDDAVLALDSGANDYVTKPINFDVLVARIRSQLRQRDATRASIVPSTVPPGPRDVLELKYKLERKLGTGGFGTVYRARHLTLDTHVAIKMLHAHHLDSATMRARFEREGVSACRVRHPNAVAVLDAGTTAEGVPYLVMELLEGPSLQEELNRELVLPLARVAQIAAPVCDVLSEAHRSGVIHRDIKPANILLATTPRGEVVKVLDFGIAKLVDEVFATLPTAGDQVLGTPNYMAPERLLGRTVDERSDIYSVGAMLYEMLGGSLPFGEALQNPFGQALRQLQEAPTPLCELRPDLPDELSRLVMQTLAPEPAERPALATIGETLVACAGRWAEPEWPLPQLAQLLRRAGPRRVLSHMDSTMQLADSAPERKEDDPSAVKATRSERPGAQADTTKRETPERKR